MRERKTKILIWMQNCALLRQQGEGGSFFLIVIMALCQGAIYYHPGKKHCFLIFPLLFPLAASSNDAAMCWRKIIFHNNSLLQIGLLFLPARMLPKFLNCHFGRVYFHQLGMSEIPIIIFWWKNNNQLIFWSLIRALWISVGVFCITRKLIGSESET